MPGHHVLSPSASASSDASDSHSSLPVVSHAVLCFVIWGAYILHPHRRRPLHYLQHHCRPRGSQLLHRNETFGRARFSSSRDILLDNEAPNVSAPTPLIAPSVRETGILFLALYTNLPRSSLLEVRSASSFGLFLHH